MNKKIDLRSLNFDQLRTHASHMQALWKKGDSAAKISGGGAILGAGFNMVSAERDERAFLADIAEEYRPEIAQRLGLSPEQVSPEHLTQAIAENPILQQAKQASGMSMKAKTISGAISVLSGLIAGLGVAVMTRNANQHVHKDMQQNATNIASGLVSTFSALLGGGITRRLVHKRSNAEKSLERTAHGAIMAIKDKQQQGVPTTELDIFKVQMLVNPEIADAIEKAYGKPFDALDEGAKYSLLGTEFPEILAYNAEMAGRINQGARPQGLLFGEVVAAEGARERPSDVSLNIPQPDAPDQHEVAQESKEDLGIDARLGALPEDIRAEVRAEMEEELQEALEEIREGRQELVADEGSGVAGEHTQRIQQERASTSAHDAGVTR